MSRKRVVDGDGGWPGRPGGADRLLRMSQGFVPSAILRTALDLGVFDHLAGGSADVAGTAAAIGADPRGVRIFLDALAALGLVERAADGYRLVPGSERFVVSGSSEFVGGLVHAYASDVLWDAMGRLAQAVRRGGAGATDLAGWKDLASSLSSLPGAAPAALADVLAPWSGRRDTLEVVDLGCGNGAFGYAVLARHPGARLRSLDWPDVVEVAREQAARAGVLDRVHFVEGDLFEAPLGGPCDLVILSHVLHHFSPERARRLLARAGGALRPGGRVAIHDFVVTDASPAEDSAPHLFSAILLAWTAEGQVHSLAAYEEMLAESGFGPASVHAPDGLATRFVIADRAPAQA